METILVISSVALWIAIGFILILLLAIVQKVHAFQQMGKPETLKIGVEAPDFTVETLSGDVIRRANLIGNEIAMVFVSPGCTGCKDFMPKFQKLYPKAQQAGVEFMVISLADAEQTGAYVRELDFTAPIYTAPSDTNPLLKEFKVPGTPSYYLIDQQGKIKAGGFFDTFWQETTAAWSD